MLSKYSLFFVCSLTLTACSNSNKADSTAENAIGSWELIKMVSPEGKSVDVKKPTPDDSDDNYFQLVITKNRLMLIDSDTVTVKLSELPIVFSGSRIQTIDQANLKMPDYEVVSVTANTLTFRVSDDEKGGYHPIQFVAARIPEDQTALRTALIFTKPQVINVSIEGIMDTTIKTIGGTSSESRQKSIGCYYDKKSDSLNLQHIEFNKTENGVSFGGDSDQILLKLPLSHLEAHTAAALQSRTGSITTAADSLLEHLTLDKTQWKSFGDDGCLSYIEKSGPLLQIKTRCQSKNPTKRGTPLELNSSCLLIRPLN